MPDSPRMQQSHGRRTGAIELGFVITTWGAYRMAIETSFDDHRVFTLVPTGNVTLEEMTSAARDLLTDRRFVEPIRVIRDLRACRFDWSAERIKTFRQFVLGHRPPGRGRVAAVAAGDLTFGRARMYEAFRGEGPVELMVFRDVDEARAWVHGSY